MVPIRPTFWRDILASHALSFRYQSPNSAHTWQSYVTIPIWSTFLTELIIWQSYFGHIFLASENKILQYCVEGCQIIKIWCWVSQIVKNVWKIGQYLIEWKSAENEKKQNSAITRLNGFSNWVTFCPSFV